MAEAALVRAVSIECRQRGAYWMNVLGTAGGDTGRPDLWAVHRGRAVLMELKTPTGRVSPKQAHHIERARRAGAIAGVVRTIEDARLLLDAAEGQP